jgi:CPA1 family monovalent cation:H+ antiporter
MSTAQEILSKIPLFSMLPEKEIAKLAANAHDLTFPAESLLTEEKEMGATFGVIVSGQASVSVHGQSARTLSTGDYFGEMALVDRAARSAKITADTEVRCLLFTAWVFRPFAVEHPETAWALLERMVQRVREAEARQS